MTARSAALLAPLILCGSAAPPPPPPAARPAREDLVVLLPDKDGKTGALSVTHAGAERVLDTPLAAARIKDEGPIETGTSTPDEVKRTFGDALAAQPLRPVSFL